MYYKGRCYTKPLNQGKRKIIIILLHFYHNIQCVCIVHKHNEFFFFLHHKKNITAPFFNDDKNWLRVS